MNSCDWTLSPEKRGTNVPVPHVHALDPSLTHGTSIYLRRYILDGDRDELRNIRHELASLRDNILRSPDHATNSSFAPCPNTHDDESKQSSPGQSHVSEGGMNYVSALRRQMDELRGTGLYDDDDPVMRELRQAIKTAQ